MYVEPTRGHAEFSLEFERRVNSKRITYSISSFDEFDAETVAAHRHRGFQLLWQVGEEHYEKIVATSLGALVNKACGLSMWRDSREVLNAAKAAWMAHARAEMDWISCGLQKERGDDQRQRDKIFL